MKSIVVGCLIFLVYCTLPFILGDVNDTGPVVFEETFYQDENDPYCCRNSDFYGSGREEILSDSHLYDGENLNKTHSDDTLETELEEELYEQGNPSGGNE